jgi:hypothetical protein
MGRLVSCTSGYELLAGLVLCALSRTICAGCCEVFLRSIVHGRGYDQVDHTQRASVSALPSSASSDPHERLWHSGVVAATIGV